MDVCRGIRVHSYASSVHERPAPERKTMSASTYFTRIAPIVGLGAICLVASADTAQFSIHKVMDTDAHHLAISYLIPMGWSAADSIRWNIQQGSAPLQISTAVTSSDGKFAVRWLNRVVFSYGHLGDRGTRGKD